MYFIVFSKSRKIITNFGVIPKAFLFAMLLIVTFATHTYAQNSQEERIRILEERIRQLTNEIKELRKGEKETPAAERMKSIEEKLAILTEEINNIKSGIQEEIEVVPVPEAKGVFGLAPAASKIYARERGFSIGGYGELAVGKIVEDGDNILDAQRVVFYVGYRFNENILFNSEIEFEHGSTSKNLDGKGGSVSLEFGYLDFLIKDYFNLRGGLLLVPVGITNELHEPTMFYGVFRPSVERQIIPTTWREGGFGAFGTLDLHKAGSISYRAYLLNSSDSRGFESSGNRKLRTKGNRARFNDLAFAGRVEYEPYPGIELGGSIYFGNTGQGEEVENEASPLYGESIDGFFQMYSADAQFRYRGLDIKTLVVWTFLDDVEKINANLGFEGEDSVGEEQFGWYVVAAYNIMSELDFKSPYLWYLAPFVRYEYYDTQKEVPAGFSKNPENERQEFTIGLNYKPIPNVVIKADYQWLDNDAGSSKNQFNFALGYVF